MGIGRPQLDDVKNFTHYRYMMECRKLQERLAKIMQAIELVQTDMEKIENYRLRLQYQPWRRSPDAISI